MFDVPSKEAPEIVLAVASLVAVAAFPDNEPLKVVAFNCPVDELNVRLEPV